MMRGALGKDDTVLGQERLTTSWGCGRTIVSVTPKALEHDSRTLKQVLSFSRWGFRSIVFEGLPSRADFSRFPFELHSLRPATGDRPPPPAAEQTVSSPPIPAAPRRWRDRFAGTLPWRLARAAIIGFERSPAGRILDAAACLKISRTYLHNFVLSSDVVIPAADLYWVHSYEYVPRLLIRAGRLRKPVVFDFHDLYGNIFEDLSRSALPADRWWGRMIHGLVRLAMWKGRQVVTVSPGLADEFAALYGRRPEVLRNCHDSRLDRPAIAGLRHRLGLGQDCFLLVTMGDCKPAQAIAEGLRALASLPESIHWVLIGRGYGRHAGLIGELGLGARVHDLGPVDPDEVVPLLKGADAALVSYFAITPDYLHCLPNGFFQSAAAGLPLIYPRLPDIEAIAGPLDLGIAVEARDSVAVAAAIAALAGDPDLRARFCANVAAAWPVLSWGGEEHRLAALLADCLGEGGRPCAA